MPSALARSSSRALRSLSRSLPICSATAAGHVSRTIAATSSAFLSLRSAFRSASSAPASANLQLERHGLPDLEPHRLLERVGQLPLPLVAGLVGDPLGVGLGAANGRFDRGLHPADELGVVALARRALVAGFVGALCPALEPLALPGLVVTPRRALDREGHALEGLRALSLVLLLRLVVYAVTRQSAWVALWGIGQ